jgi:hypothetical protein
MLKKLTLWVVLILPSGIVAGYAQSATTSSGGDGKGAGGLVSWSVGQTAYTSFAGKGGTNSISSGVQQAYSISMIAFKNALSLLYSVFPNPTADNLILQTPNFKNGIIAYQLLDMQGNVLRSGFISGNRTEINTGSLPSSTYFLQVLQGIKQVQSFKIIKN